MASLPQRQIVEAAATWYVQFQSEAPTDRQRQAWQRWLDSDPAHRVAWEHMEQMQRHLGALPREASRRALSAGQQRRQVLKLLALVGATGYLGWNLRDRISPSALWADYRTAVGAHRSIELADGTRIELNTDTAVDIRYDAQQRLIRLLQGEILVNTGKRGDQRPLYVATREGRVQALGTVFSVRQLSTATRVGVLEDQVRISPKDAPADDQRLKAGESAEFDGLHVSAHQPYTASQAAWVNGQLIVLDATLGEVAEELERYRPGRLRCEPQAARLRVSGTFKVNDSDAVLSNLQATLPISVSYFSRYWVTVRHR
jgi:transmembrane sensor